MNLNELVKDIHQNAVEHGWWQEERSFGEIIALCHSELSEALEEYRDGRPMLWHKEEGESILYAGDMPIQKISNYKPEGVAVELADCIIRILDYCGKADIDIEEAVRIKHEYNKTRPWKHGGKVI